MSLITRLKAVSGAFPAILAGLCIGALAAPAKADPALTNYGLYLGLHGAYFDGFIDRSPPATGFSDANPSGFGFGGTLGYEWLVHDTWLFGVVGDYTFSGAGEESFEGFVDVTSHMWGLNSYGSLRGKFGLAFDPRVVLYLTGGVAAVNATVEEGTDSVEEKLTGWTLGGGLDVHLTRSWSMNVEYLHNDYGEWQYTLPSGDASVGVSSEVLKLGARYSLSSLFNRYDHEPLK